MCAVLLISIFLAKPKFADTTNLRKQMFVISAKNTPTSQTNFALICSMWRIPGIGKSLCHRAAEFRDQKQHPIQNLLFPVPRIFLIKISCFICIQMSLRLKCNNRALTCPPCGGGAQSVFCRRVISPVDYTLHSSILSCKMQHFLRNYVCMDVESLKRGRAFWNSANNQV